MASLSTIVTLDPATHGAISIRIKVNFYAAFQFGGVRGPKDPPGSPQPLPIASGVRLGMQLGDRRCHPDIWAAIDKLREFYQARWTTFKPIKLQTNAQRYRDGAWACRVDLNGAPSASELPAHGPMAGALAAGVAAADVGRRS